jgi:SAP domain-containing ribonucleoprotein
LPLCGTPDTEVSILFAFSHNSVIKRKHRLTRMTDYNSLKVPDLKKLLGERSLPLSGNKSDLIARLQEHDKKPSNITGM